MAITIKVCQEVKKSCPDMMEAIDLMESLEFDNWRKAYDYMVGKFGSTFLQHCSIN